MDLIKGTDKVKFGNGANVKGTIAHAAYTDRPILMKFPMAYGRATLIHHIRAILNMNSQWIKSERFKK
jgi:hypothetical protein